MHSNNCFHFSTNFCRRRKPGWNKC